MEKAKSPQKGAVKKLRELWEKNKGTPSTTLGEALKDPKLKKKQDKVSALPLKKKDLEL